jgi:mutator family transposase
MALTTCHECTKKGVPAIGPALDQDWDRLVAFYELPKAYWKHLRTSNPIESPFAAVRLRTAAAKRYKKVENATAVIWKTLRLLRVVRIRAALVLIGLTYGCVTSAPLSIQSTSAIQSVSVAENVQMPENRSWGYICQASSRPFASSECVVKRLMRWS